MHWIIVATAFAVGCADACGGSTDGLSNMVLDPGGSIGTGSLTEPDADGSVSGGGGVFDASGVSEPDGGGPAASGGTSDTPPVAGPCSAVAVGDTYAAAAAVVTAMAPCGSSSCHGGIGRAGLVLLGVTDLRAALVGRTACEAPQLSLVDGSGGAAALARSWLWLKLTASTGAGAALLPNPAWGEPDACGQPGDQPYGVLMPLGSQGLDEVRLNSIRDWICSGAPGP